MTDAPPKTKSSGEPERIAKAMARAGVASRRDAERMILAGRVAVNGAVVTSPALDVTPSDKVTLDGKPIDAPQATRLWLYYKPLGLVTSEKDEKGRQTVFESLPDGMPRVMSVGRLDLNSEGLLLLTNDGALKRQLELPETGWLRKYRVRVNGHPTDQMLKPLREGVTVKTADGTTESFLPMDITIDRQQGANAWLTVGLREGKNREIRRAMTEIGLVVNRLIRVSYGPFRLNEMKPGEVSEVKARVMREQLGGLLGEEEAPRKGLDRKPRRAGTGGEDRAPRKPRDGSERAERKPRQSKAAREDGGFAKSERFGSGDRDQRGDRPARSARPAREGTADDRPRKSFGKPGAGRTGGTETKQGGDFGDRPRRTFGPKSEGTTRPSRAAKPEDGQKRDRSTPSRNDKPRSEGNGDKPFRRDRTEGPAKPRDRSETRGPRGEPGKAGFDRASRKGADGRSGASAGPSGDRGKRPSKPGAPKTGASGFSGGYRGGAAAGGGKSKSSGPKGNGPKGNGPRGTGPKPPRGGTKR